MIERISWDELFMGIAVLYSRRSVCRHFEVGVVIAKEKHILSAGYNGPPSGEPHCKEVGCAKEDSRGKRLPASSGLCRGAHAEMNAIANATLHGVNLAGSSIYCIYSPCYDCAKILTNLGIKEFVYLKDYKDENPKAKELFERRGIKIRKIKLKDEI